jgi:hypothetical protein
MDTGGDRPGQFLAEILQLRCSAPRKSSLFSTRRSQSICHITRNWQGVPLETLEVIVQLIGSTRTSEGLEVHAWLDERTYEKGRKVTPREFEELHIKPNKFHGEWNYEIHPRN